MHTAKYLIHADIRTSGVVERSDVVGAVFGQTEGLLGEELDLRSLQDASKVGRIDVEIQAEDGRSYGQITIATALDRAETAVLAAALETIDRVGPSRAEVTVADIEDARVAERRAVVDRATELLADIEESSLTDDRLIEAVRERARIADVTTYEGLPAGPRVADSDAIIVVEGRSDVRRLLRYGIKNAVAVEGTDVPDAVAALTAERTVTAFLDGDRGGDLILRELAQVGDVDYVAFAPDGQSVEDLDRETAVNALRKKVPYDQVPDSGAARAVFTGDESRDGSTASAGESSHRDGSSPDSTAEQPRDNTTAEAANEPTEGNTVESRDDGGTRTEPNSESEVEPEPEPGTEPVTETETDTADEEVPDREPATLQEHVSAVIGDETGRGRLLDGSFAVLDEVDAADTFEAVADADPVPTTVVLDGVADQRLLDIAAQRGVREIVAAHTGEYVKQPTSVRIRTAEQLATA